MERLQWSQCEFTIESATTLQHYRSVMRMIERLYYHTVISSPRWRFHLPELQVRRLEYSSENTELEIAEMYRLLECRQPVSHF